MQLVSPSKPKTRIQLRETAEMRADFPTCALLGKKAAPGWTSTAPKPADGVDPSCN